MSGFGGGISVANVLFRKPDNTSGSNIYTNVNGEIVIVDANNKQVNISSDIVLANGKDSLQVISGGISTGDELHLKGSNQGIDGTVKILDEKNSTGIGSGSLVVNGGASIEKDLFIGSNLMVGGKINLATIPTAANDVPNKSYVDSVAKGFGPKLSVKVKTTVAEANYINNELNCEYFGSGLTKRITNRSDGAAEFDGVILDDSDRILVAGGSAASIHYGIYTVFDKGSSGTPWILLRSEDCNDNPVIGEVSVGIYTFVSGGQEFKQQGWSLITYGGQIDVDTQLWSLVSQLDGGIFAEVLGQNTGNNALQIISNNTVSLDPRQITDIGLSTEPFTLNSSSLEISTGTATITGATAINGATTITGIASINTTGGAATNIGPTTITGATAINGATAITGNITINPSATSSFTTAIGRSTITSNSLSDTITLLGSVNINATGIRPTIIGSASSGGPGSSTTIIRSGLTSGLVNINVDNSSPTNIGTGSTTSAVSIGGTATAQSINIKSAAASAGTVNIGAGTVAVFIGSGTTTGSVTIGNLNNLSLCNSPVTNSTSIATKNYVDTVFASSQKIKHNITDLEIDTEKIFELKSKSFVMNETGKKSFGFIAEEVDILIPELCRYGNDGEPDGVYYHLLSVMLLEELKKQKEKIDYIMTKITLQGI